MAARPIAPVVVAYGMGVDSTAMLVGMHARGEPAPDLILFADTGGEKTSTYDYLPTIQAWLRSVGWPEVIVVRRKPGKSRKLPGVTYATLEENCLVNETLPSLAFGFKGCSLKWKVEPQNRYVSGWAPAKAIWAHGLKVTKLIGYDSGKADSRRSKIQEDDQYAYRYPLREWGWTREDCEAAIRAAGLPLPTKSACYYCPASRLPEVELLAREEPAKFLAAVRMEDRARAGAHGLGTTAGLNRHFSWRSVGERLGLVEPLEGAAPAVRAPKVADEVAETAGSL